MRSGHRLAEEICHRSSVLRQFFRQDFGSDRAVKDDIRDCSWTRACMLFLPQSGHLTLPGSQAVVRGSTLVLIRDEDLRDPVWIQMSRIQMRPIRPQEQQTCSERESGDIPASPFSSEHFSPDTYDLEVPHEEAR